MKIEINRTPGVIAALDYLNIHFSTPVIGRINQFPKAPLLWVKKISPKLYLARECNANDAFKALKAGREELRKEICSDQCEDTQKEPAWIPWNGSYKSPIVGKQTKFEVKFRDGVMQIYTQNNPLCWRHNGNFSDIIAYRILN